MYDICVWSLILRTKWTVCQNTNLPMFIVCTGKLSNENRNQIRNQQANNVAKWICSAKSQAMQTHINGMEPSRAESSLDSICISTWTVSNSISSFAKYRKIIDFRWNSSKLRLGVSKHRITFHHCKCHVTNSKTADFNAMLYFPISFSFQHRIEWNLCQFLNSSPRFLIYLSIFSQKSSKNKIIRHISSDIHSGRSPSMFS